MIKNSFILIAVVIVVGIAGWFFVNKARNASRVSDLASVASETPDATPVPSSMEENTDTTGNWIKLPSGLQIKDVVIGYGKEAREGDIVAAHYTGTLEDGTKFDSSYDRGEPFAFPLGGGMVIKGWDLGLVGMKVGGKRKLIIPSELGYGSRGAGDAIPPGTTLYFDIELVAAQTPTRK